MGRGKNRGRRMRNERKRAAHDDLSDDELDATLAEIQEGSDRVAAVMGAALVQNTLMGALIQCLEDDGDVAKVFDSLRGPLNTFYSQIVMGKALGLFDEAIADALHTVRSIRNHFAHAAITLTFENDPEIAKKCRALAWLDDDEIPKTEGEPDERRFYEHACYELTCQVMAAGSQKLRDKAKRMEATLAIEMMSRRKNQLGKLNSLLELIPRDLEGSD
jgi:hypothetical protein